MAKAKKQEGRSFEKSIYEIHIFVATDTDLAETDWYDAEMHEDGDEEYVPDAEMDIHGVLENGVLLRGSINKVE